jgi:GNAT superfamily N-acetyltransferase
VLPLIEVRDADAADVESLVRLWGEMTVGTGHQSRLLVQPSHLSARAAIARQAGDPYARLVVAELDGEVAAMAYLRRAPISPLHDEDTVTVEYLHVADAARRHGLGKALIAEAAAWAEEVGSPGLAVIARASARDANRFFARLGLGQAAVVRFASTHKIRRRLAAAHSPNLLGLISSRRSVLARRAMLQRQAPEPEVTLPAARESTGM